MQAKQSLKRSSYLLMMIASFFASSAGEPVAFIWRGVFPLAFAALFAFTHHQRAVRCMPAIHSAACLPSLVRPQANVARTWTNLYVFALRKSFGPLLLRLSDKVNPRRAAIFAFLWGLENWQLWFIHPDNTNGVWVRFKQPILIDRKGRARSEATACYLSRSAISMVTSHGVFDRSSRSSSVYFGPAWETSTALEGRKGSSGSAVILCETPLHSPFPPSDPLWLGTPRAL